MHLIGGNGWHPSETFESNGDCSTLLGLEIDGNNAPSGLLRIIEASRSIVSHGRRFAAAAAERGVRAHVLSHCKSKDSQSSSPDAVSANRRTRSRAILQIFLSGIESIRPAVASLSGDFQEAVCANLESVHSRL